MLSPSNSSPKKEKSKIPCLQDEDKEDALLHPTKGDILALLRSTKRNILPKETPYGIGLRPIFESYSEEGQAVENKNKQVSCQDEDIELLPEAATTEFNDNFLIADAYGHLIGDSEEGQAVENKNEQVVETKNKQKVQEKDGGGKPKIEQAVGKNKPKIISDLTNLIKEVKGLPPPPPPLMLNGHLFRGFTEKEEDPENEHFKHYMNLLAESKGYYTPKVPEGVKIAYSRPAPILPHNFDKLELRAKNALDWYNNEKKGDEIYELVRVECASQYVMCGIRYLIAFIARGVDSGREVPFRAKVRFGVGGVITVESCERVAESSAKFAQLRGKCC